MYINFNLSKCCLKFVMKIKGCCLEFVMKIKGSVGVAKWQNACIIKAEFGQIDLGMRT